MGILSGIDEEQSCPNGHLAHRECLKEWLIQSSNCPVCQESYPNEVIQSFQDFISEREKEKQLALNQALKQEEIKKVEKLAERIAFLKFQESIEILINANEYDYALSRLDFHNNGNVSTEKGRIILFLKGKVNFLRGRYDLAINQLFKLVKEKYDYPEGFLYLGKAYEALGLADKAKWAYDRVN